VTWRLRSAGALVIAAFCAAAAAAQTVPETFTATASVKKGGVSASAPATVTVTRYSSAAERDTVMKALRESGVTGAQKALAAMGDAGFIQLGEKRTPIKFASVRPTDSGRLVTVVTSAPMLYLGAGLPDSKPIAGFDVAIALLDLPNGGAGLGELAPAAKIGLDEGGAILIEDYGPTVVWLNGLAKR
jgi:hypothetical protein